MNNLLHISWAPETTVEQEREQLGSLTKLQRRYLSGRACALCDQYLHHVGCGAIDEACDEAVRIERRARCLENYKPRPSRRKQEPTP